MVSLTGLAFLIGAWSCSYTAGGHSTLYSTTFGYDLGKNWIVERDTYGGGGGAVAYLTNDRKAYGLTYAVFGSDRSTTIFRAGDDQPSYIVWRSVFPKQGLTDVFQRVSSKKFTLHFSGVLDGQAVTSSDVCTKH